MLPLFALWPLNYSSKAMALFCPLSELESVTGKRWVKTKRRPGKGKFTGPKGGDGATQKVALFSYFENSQANWEGSRSLDALSIKLSIEWLVKRLWVSCESSLAKS